MKRDLLKTFTDTEKKEIVKRIINLRKDCLHLTQPQFAERLGYSQTYISLVERGERELSGDLVASILSEIKTSKSWLLYGSGTPFDAEAATKDALSLFRSSYNLLPEDEEYIRWYLSQSPEMRKAVITLRDTALTLQQFHP